MKTPFSKMNGLGNQIIVADLRDSKDAFTPQAILTLAADHEAYFDQIMAIHPPTQKNLIFALKYGMLTVQWLKLAATVPVVS